MSPIVGFLPADDERVVSTIEAVIDGLTDERGLVYRYRSPHGLRGEEATFGMCTYWLTHALALAGDVDRARACFTTVTAFAEPDRSTSVGSVVRGTIPPAGRGTLRGR